MYVPVDTALPFMSVFATFGRVDGRRDVNDWRRG